jgi:hypothetical protein
MVRTSFQPDITLVLQHDATARSSKGHLARLNRNVFFIHGAYTHRELTEDGHQRFKMLTKLLANVTPIEATVADHIANRFVSITGFRPVKYGNSSITRSVGNPYVVARNLALNREHDGPVVVIEPYFMNEPITLQRLLEGDYDGVRYISGELRPSIYREYADAVTLGILDAYGYRAQVSPKASPPTPDTALLETLSTQFLSIPTLKIESTPVIRLPEILSDPPPQPPSLKDRILTATKPFVRPALIVGLLLGVSVGLFWVSTRQKN